MTEFITQNMYLILISMAIGIMVGLTLATARRIKRCKECVLLRACAVRELKRMEDAEPTEITTAWRERGKSY